MRKGVVVTIILPIEKSNDMALALALTVFMCLCHPRVY